MRIKIVIQQFSLLGRTFENRRQADHINLSSLTKRSMASSVFFRASIC